MSKLCLKTMMAQFNGKIKTLSEWSNLTGVTVETLYSRKYKNKPLLTYPQAYLLEQLESAVSRIWELQQEKYNVR